MPQPGKIRKPVRPPGPESKGLIGNFPLAGDEPFAVFARWARQYGDIFHYRVLNRHVYFLNHPDFIEYILKTNARNFTKGQALSSNRRIFGNGLLTSEGEFWLRQRRLIQPAFLQERIASYAADMTAFAERMVAGWRDGETRDVHAEMMRLTLEIASKVLFDFPIAADTDRVSSALNTLMELAAHGRMLLPRVFRMLPTRSGIRYWRAARQLDDIVFGIIRQRRFSGGDSGDLISRLMNVRDEDGGTMTDQQVRDEAMTLLLAGHETTAVALSWTWFLLAQHSEVEQKLWDELESVLKGRTPGVGDVPRLPYMNRVIRESMRLYPPAWAMARVAVEDCEIGGYRVPAGSSVAMSQWVMHRDPRFYRDPERFNPDRWAEERMKALPKFAYFPFGGGPRICIGASFAMLEIALTLATVAQKYQLHLAPGHTVTPLASITLRPKEGIHVILKQR